MRPHLLVIGASHRTARLALRERLVIPSRELPAALASLRACTGIDEAAILSTCNRLELYVSSRDPSASFPDLVDFLSHRSRLAPATLHTLLYRHVGADAARHLFRVTAGLDSMVLGESEITAQVKQAYAIAQAEGATGAGLNRLFQKALHSTKLVRTKTPIAQGQASIGSVVVSLSRSLFGERLSTCQVLLWGAGKAAEVTARHLIKQSIRHLWVVSRTAAKAQGLASLCQSMCPTGWLSWEEARDHLRHVDIAVICTQAPHYVIDAEDIADVLPHRGGRPLCLIDLAVPRNVDPALADKPDIRLHNIDDLQSLASAGMSQRTQAVTLCEQVIRQQVDHFTRASSLVALPEPQQQGARCDSVLV